MIAQLLPDLLEIRRKLDEAESPLRSANERDLAIGDALRLLCQNFKWLTEDRAVWEQAASDQRRIEARLGRDDRELLLGTDHLDRTAFEIVGRVLDKAGWRPPDLAAQLRGWRREVAKSMSPDEAVAAAARGTALAHATQLRDRACRMERRHNFYVAEARVREEQRSRRIKFGRRALEAALALVRCSVSSSMYLKR